MLAQFQSPRPDPQRPACSGLPLLSVLANTTCEVDRSTIALFYSRNLLDWNEAGLIDYTLAYHRHFAYPNAIIDGNDIVMVSRSTIGGSNLHPCATAVLSPDSSCSDSCLHKLVGFYLLELLCGRVWQDNSVACRSVFVVRAPWTFVTA
jgi:hypothetical protein